MAITDQIEPVLAKAADHRHRTGRPFVTLSFAQSLDGCITTKRGQPLTLSGAQSLRLTHQLRAAHDSILVGIGTILSDDPRLTVRLVGGHNPRPVVVDSRLRFPLDARLLRDHPQPPWIATSEKAEGGRQESLESRGARVLRLSANAKGQVNLVALLEHLGSLGINSLMVEGGARVITSFLQERLVNLLVLTISPTLVGGLHAVECFGVSDPSLFPRLIHPSCEWLGEDLIYWGHLAWGQA